MEDQESLGTLSVPTWSLARLRLPSLAWRGRRRAVLVCWCRVSHRLVDDTVSGRKSRVIVYDHSGVGWFDISFWA